MTKIKYKNQVLTFLVIFILSINVLRFTNEIKDFKRTLVNPLTPKTQAVINFYPLIIDDNGGGNFTWDEAALEAWCSGLGTVNDPYIVKNLNIDGKDEGSCFEIRNSNVSAIIQYCDFFNAGYFANKFYAGIKLFNVSNIQIINNTCSNNNGFGIYITNSNNITLEGNQVKKNGHGQFYNYNGIVFYNSDYNRIIRNDISNNGAKGIRLDVSNYNILIDNSIFSSGNYGIYTYFCHNNTIHKNTVAYNSWSIGIYYSDYHNISENLIKNSEVGVFCQHSDYNIITQNRIRTCTQGIYLLQSDYNSVLRNSLADYKYCIDEELCVGNLISDNNCEKAISGYDLYLLLIFSFMISSVIILLYYRRKSQTQKTTSLLI